MRTAVLAVLIAVMSVCISSPAVAASRPLFGVTVHDAAALRADTRQFGHLPVIHVYYRELPDPAAWSTGLPARARSAVIVAFNAPPGQVLAGRDDAALRRFFGSAPRGHRIWWSYIHEPESQIIDGQFTAAAYRKAWRHVTRLARAAGNRWLRATLLLTAYDLRDISHRNWRDYFPGRRWIDVLGWDAYPGPGDTQLKPPARFMHHAVGVSRRARLPFGFAEFGVTAQPGRPAWLRAVGRYIRRSSARFGTLFDSQPPGAPPLILRDAPSIAAWRHVVRRSVR